MIKTDFDLATSKVTIIDAFCGKDGNNGKDGKDGRDGKDGNDGRIKI